VIEVEVLTGVLVNAISFFAKWSTSQAVSPRGSRARQIDLVRWYETYLLTPDANQIPSSLREFDGGELTDIIARDSVQASIQELLAARMTAAPESDIEKIRHGFERAIDDVSDNLNQSMKTELFDYYDDSIGSIVASLSASHPDIFRELRQDAFNTRVVAILGAIDSHFRSLDISLSRTEEQEYLENYRRHAIDYHGKIQPPDFERRQRLPLMTLYVPPTITEVAVDELVRSSRRGKKRPHQSTLLFELADNPHKLIPLSKLVSEIDRTVLLGDPGGGKSTASNYAVYQHALNPKGRVPFLVILREFRSRDRERRSIADFIESNLNALYQCPPPVGLVRKLLSTGEALVIFDGLDELIDTSLRAEVTDAVEQFCTEYPLTRVMVTSRIVGYSEARLDDTQFTCYRITGFSRDQVQEYVTNWFSQDAMLTQSDAQKWTASFMGESASVLDLRSNPLLLALMCILYNGTGSIPQNRPDVYEKCADLMFRKWDMRRRITVELRRPNLLEPALRDLAFWMFTEPDGNATVTERALEAKLTEFFKSRGIDSDEDALAGAVEFAAFCRGRAWVFSDAGTTARGERLYRFTHRTFLEYFAAAHLAVSSDTPEKLASRLIPHIAKQEWSVVAELAVQKKDQINDHAAQRVIKWLLRSRRYSSPSSRGNILAFVARLLSSTQVTPQAVKEITVSAIEHLRSGGTGEPLAAAMSCPEGMRETVAAEIIRKVDEFWATGERGQRSLAMRLAIVDDMLLMQFEPRSMSTVNFWRNFSQINYRRYSAEVAQVLPYDTFLTRSAITRGIVNFSDILSADAGYYFKLWQEVSWDAVPGGWTGFFPWIIEIAALRPHMLLEPLSGPLLSSLIWLGDYVSTLPTTPWFTTDLPFDVDSDFLHYSATAEPLPDIKDAPLRPLIPDAQLGLTLLVCSMIEFGYPFIEADALMAGIERVVPGLGSYLRKRVLGDVGDLPELPFSGDVRGTLRRWANRSVNLLKTSRLPEKVSRFTI
jgi:hypothetical protein